MKTLTVQAQSKKGKGGQVGWLPLVNVQGRAVRVKMWGEDVAGTGQRGTVGGLGSCTHTLQQSPPRTTYHTAYTCRRNQQTWYTTTPECGILVLRSNHGATHRTIGGALASGRGRA